MRTPAPWTCSHYTLLELKNLRIDLAVSAARRTVQRILADETQSDGGVSPTGSVTNSDVCVNAMAINYASYFGATQQQLVSMVDFAVSQQMPDGGFNCRSNRVGAHPRSSSMHTTVSMLEAATEYLRQGHTHRADQVRSTQAGCAEFLLAHRLFRRISNGAVIKPEFTLLHDPARWHFDILRGLDALADAGFTDDPRAAEALDLLISKRRPDGRWAADRGYVGHTHLTLPRAGQPNPFITETALRVLSAFGLE